MYNIVIADDEKLIRTGLKEGIPWTDLGFYVNAVFSDGEDLLEYVSDNPVDVILTDINMCPVSGIDIARYVHENKLNIKVVFISGYQEFEYAKDAITYSVINYILKPINLSEIKSFFTELKSHLDKEREESKFISDKLNKHDELLNNLKEEWYQKLYFSRDLNKNDIDAYTSKLYKACDSAGIKSIIFSLTIEDFDYYCDNAWKYGRESFNNAINNVLSLDSSIELFYISGREGSELYIAIDMDNRYDEDRFEQYLQQKQLELSENLKITSSITKIAYFKDLYALAEYQPQSADGSCNQIDLDRMSDDIVKQALIYINKNYDKDISLAKLAQTLFIGKTYLCRRFKEKVGLNFLEYLTDLRLTEAAKLLQNGTKITAVTSFVGYNDARYFAKLFKTKYNCSPSEYIKRNKW